MAWYALAGVAAGWSARPDPGTSAADPARLRPPDRAGYPVLTGSRYVTVRLDAASRDRLEHVQAQAARRLGPWVLVDAWLTRDPAGHVNVHIGQQPVGTVDDGAAYDGTFTAAALFDEDPVLTARLVPDPEPILELPLPRPARPARPTAERIGPREDGV